MLLYVVHFGGALVTSKTTHHTAAAVLATGAVLANVAFVGLGSTFDYPDVLGRQAGEVLATFKANESAIVLWFLVLALGAGLLAPAAVLVAQVLPGRWAPWSKRVGVAAAAVQVLGLLRWPLVAPFLAARALDPDPAVARRAVETFGLLNTILGTVVGESLGYALTAGWTVLIVVTLGRRWLAAVGLGAAILITAGLGVPVGVPGADLANFVGYVVWSLWLLALAVHLWKSPVDGAALPGVR